MGIVGDYAVAIITAGDGPATRQSDGDYAHEWQLNRLAALLAERIGALRAPRRPAAWRSELDQPAGLVVDRDGHFAQLVLVLTGMVGAEKQLCAAGEFNADVGLCAAAIAAVDC